MVLCGIVYGGIIFYVVFVKFFLEGFNFGWEVYFNNVKIVFLCVVSELNLDYLCWDCKCIEEICWELLMNGYLDCLDIIDLVVLFVDLVESYMKYVD